MTTDKSKRKLVAVVHADLKGYSRMMGRNYWVDQAQEKLAGS